jgi:NAD(P)H-flavin reductase
LNAQTQENNRKCCVVIGCFNTDKDPCKPSRAYEAVPAEMEEISRIKKEFSVKHPFPEVPWGFYPGQYVVVIEYPNKGCNTKGMAFVYSNSKESCLEQIDKSVLEGYYNKDLK